MNMLKDITIKTSEVSPRELRPVSISSMKDPKGFSFGLSLKEGKAVKRNGFPGAATFEYDNLRFIYTGLGYSVDKSRVFVHFRTEGKGERSIKEKVIRLHIDFFRSGMLYEARLILQLLKTKSLLLGLGDIDWHCQVALEKLGLKSSITGNGNWERFYLK